MQPLLELKFAIAKKFGSQIAASRKMGINESRLSRVVHGWDRPTPDLLAKLEKELGEEAVKRLKG